MKTSMLYRPLPMPPKITSPMCMLNSSMKPAMRRHGIMLAVVGAFGGVGDVIGPGGGVVDADADFLAFHIRVVRIDSQIAPGADWAGLRSTR